jgi:hypothetical protein
MPDMRHTSDMTKPSIYPFKSLMALTHEMVAEIDEWRRRQPDIPHRAEAIRRLIRLGLKAISNKTTTPPSI